jgi:predicted GIY-YIG superfamily endonuclease
MSAYCYLLYTDAGHTYVGATVNLDRRLRQHNKQLVGGARSTGIRVNQGLTWKRACYITLPDWKTALQLEWRWKQLGRTQCTQSRSSMGRRLHSLQLLLSLERPTSASIPYHLYPDGCPHIHWDSGELRDQYVRI